MGIGRDRLLQFERDLLNGGSIAVKDPELFCHYLEDFEDDFEDDYDDDFFEDEEDEEEPAKPAEKKEE